MTISKSKKLTRTEKRLLSLQRQLYGKDKLKTTTSKVLLEHNKVRLNLDQLPTINHNRSSDVSNYLSGDLLKITLLASILMAVQLALFWGLKNHLFILSF